MSDTPKRRMPDNLCQHLIRMSGGKQYLPAAYRIVWFRDEMGDEWGIQTKLIEGGHAAGYATVQAEVLNPAGRIIASGIKTESQTDFPAGWVEKAESGAVARALALLGFGTQFTPDLDDDGARPADSTQRVGGSSGGHERPVRPAGCTPGMRNDIDGTCPACGAPCGAPHATRLLKDGRS